MIYRTFLFAVLSAFCQNIECSNVDKISNSIAIKIVQEPASHGYLANNVNLANSNEKDLVPKTQPSNFSGPNFLHSFSNTCYSTVAKKYRFDFCPFHNITQHEIGQYWNPFKGIIGIWEEWKIENNTFVAMKFSNGDDCGVIDRKAYVYLSCGVENKILNVTEPSQCQYELIFSSPLFCHEDMLLVYPRMLPTHQQKWDLLESELHAKILTKEGYEFWLKELFVEAGFLLHPLKKYVPPKHLDINDNVTVAITSSTAREPKFSDLFQCIREYHELYEELEELKKRLDER